MPPRFYPLIFVLLWSSAFIVAKFGMTAAGPFSFLFTRFIIVMIIFACATHLMRATWPSGHDAIISMIGGVLMHGVYLGGVFYSISIGMGAGVTALIVALQPALTVLMAYFALGERIRTLQWLGIGFGMVGVWLVIHPKLGDAVPFYGLIACGVGVVAIAAGTVIQKKYLGGVDLVASNALQALAAALFYGVLLLTIEPYYLEWTPAVSLSMLWIVLAVSVGAVTILMHLIRKGQMASVSSLFFMVPLVSALMGYVAFGESFGILGLLGFSITSLGVWLVNRRP